MQVISKPWGREEIWADVPGKYLGKYLVIYEGGTLSEQYHRLKHETVMCVEGVVFLDIWDHQYGDYMCREMQHGVSYYIPAGIAHRMYCDANQGGKVLEVSTYHPDDVVRLKDRYGRS